jgi:hypothetical protein
LETERFLPAPAPAAVRKPDLPSLAAAFLLLAFLTGLLAYAI